MYNWIDLHIHSRISNDGTYAPAVLIRTCAERHIRVAAISDHNSVRGLTEATRVAAQEGVELICAAEFDCQYQGHNLHVLGYGIDTGAEILRELEADSVRREREMTSGRLEKIQALGIELNERILKNHNVHGMITSEGIAITALEDMCNDHHPLLEPYRPGNSHGNPIAEFYWDFFAEGKPAFVPSTYPELFELTAMIHELSGIAVLAHPAVNIDHNEALFAELVACGLDGVEVYSSYHDAETIAFYATLAERHGLLQTLGSDFHGRVKPAIHLGEIHCPCQDEIYSELTSMLDAMR